MFLRKEEIFLYANIFEGDNEVITWGYNINCLVTGIKAAEIESSIKDRRYPNLFYYYHYLKTNLWVFYKYIVSGQLGHLTQRGQKSYFSQPQTVEGLYKYGDICQVACGGAHTAALTGIYLVFLLLIFPFIFQF